MKRIITCLTVISISFFITGCTGDPLTSETGYDLTPLDECIDAMVEDNSNTSCDTATKEAILQEYTDEFMAEYSGVDTVYSDSTMSYSHSKDITIERVEFWFQFALLPEENIEVNYEEYKAIIMNMSTELRLINEVPEFIFSGEFFHYGDVNYKFHHDLNDDIKGEIHVFGLVDEDFTMTFNSRLSFLLEKANDEDLIEQKIMIVTGDHNAEIIVDPINDTYSYTIYYSVVNPTITVEAAEALIEAAFDASFTLVE